MGVGVSGWAPGCLTKQSELLRSCLLSKGAPPGGLHTPTRGERDGFAHKSFLLPQRVMANASPDHVNLFVIGVNKAGTSWLYTLLQKHLDVF